MIDAKNFLKVFAKMKLKNFFGVPDSVLKNFIKILDSNKSINHEVCSNEGSAVAMGIGSYLSNKKQMPVIYLQNSGLANAINPLISIAHKNVYNIPLILIVGWRGAPGKKDEPQHIEKGRITKNLLKLLNIKFFELKNNHGLVQLEKLIRNAKIKKTSLAILIKKDKLHFKSEKNKKTIKPKRIEFLKILLKNLGKKKSIISSTGYTSRELEYLRSEGYKKGRDFYMVGGMGHTFSVAYGFIKNKSKDVICIDGDGSLIMHLGSLTNIKNTNGVIRHVLFNNFSHESVGGQKTNSKNVDFKKTILGLGYSKYIKILNLSDFQKKINIFLNYKKSIFLEVVIPNGTIKNLPRPKSLKEVLSNFIND